MLPKIGAFTVDLEDWFQGLTSTNPQVDRWPTYESRVVPATHSLLALLDSHRVKATFFVLGRVADTHPGLVEEIGARGHEIGVHGYDHRFVNRLSRDEFARELDRGMSAIHRITQVDPLGHRAPYFSIDRSTLWAFDVLAQRGLRYDSSLFPTRNPLYGDARGRREPYRADSSGRLIEFPISTLRLGGHNVPIAGGFYLRTWPYAFVRWALRRVQRECLPVIVYVHPWELDLGQPRPRVTARERVTHYHGRAGLRRKIERLLTDFRFGMMSCLSDAVAR
jgi:polysaccharide deacetylase family protein (PEP-CTERM system associated)